MIVQKEISHNITIDDPITFALDYENNIKSKLESEFVDKNYMGMFIQKIASLSYISEINPISQDKLDGSAIATVKFIAEGITYNCSDILPCCRICKKSSKNISAIKIIGDCKVYININVDNLTGGLKTGQYINVQVLKSTYEIKQNIIRVNGRLFTYINVYPIYYISDKTFTQDQLNKLELYTNYINTLNELLDNADNNVDFYKDILYLYKNKKNPPNNTNIVNFMKMLESNKITKGYYSLGAELDHTEPNIIKYKSKPAAIIEYGRSAGEVFIEYLVVYINYLETLLDMVDTIKDPKTHKNIWKIYEFKKLE